MTENDSKVPWLKLVHDRDNEKDDNESYYEDKRQLSLPFDEPDTIVLIDVAHFHYTTFKRALDDIKPRWIFDIRTSPRLDRLVGHRSHALREFDRLGATYVDIFGLAGVSSYKNAAANPLFWTPIVEHFILNSDRRSGPYLALLDDDLMLKSMSRCFASSISHVTGRCVSLSKLDSDSSYQHYL